MLPALAFLPSFSFLRDLNGENFTFCFDSHTSDKTFAPKASRIEILNDGGYRSDGRRQHELRDISIDLTTRNKADGAALVSHGLTQVMVTVFGPREAKNRSKTIHNRAYINVEVNVAPFSTSERRRRSKNDKWVEYGDFVQSPF